MVAIATARKMARTSGRDANVVRMGSTEEFSGFVFMLRDAA